MSSATPARPSAAPRPGGRWNLSAWCLQRPLPALLLFALLSLLGLQAFHAMKVQTFPDIELPTLVVSAAWPGASALQIEREVARPLEQAFGGLSALRHQRSGIQDGLLTLSLAFHLDTPLAQATDDVRAALARVRAQLPAGLREPVVARLDLAATPILVYTVTRQPPPGGPATGAGTATAVGPASAAVAVTGAPVAAGAAAPAPDIAAADAAALADTELAWFIDDTVTRALTRRPGVAAVQRVGGASRELLLQLDPDRLLAQGVSAAEVQAVLRPHLQALGAGRSQAGGQEQPLQLASPGQTLEALRTLSLGLPDGRQLRLDQLADLRDGAAEVRSAALLDGRPAVAFEVLRARGASELDVAAEVRATLDALAAAHPGLHFAEAFSVVEPVRQNFDGSMLLLYEGALLAVLVVWAFLRDWRATLVAATALPLSVLPSFAVMHGVFDLGLNVLTLLSLSLVIGILVDDAIVEVENIVRHQRLGKSPRRAAREASDEIGLAVIATTFTLIAVFLPTAFLAGVPGRFFVHFGITAAVSVGFSLLVARMVTPVLAAWWLRRLPVDGAQATDDQATEPHWRALLLRLLRTALGHRRLTLAGCVSLLVLSLWGASRLPTGFMPADDMGHTQVRLELAPGSTLAETRASVDRAQALLHGIGGIASVYTAIGGGSAGGDPFAAAGAAETRRATLTLALAPRAERVDWPKSRIEAALRERLQALPGARVEVGLAGSGERFTLRLLGDDPAALATRARALELALRERPEVGALTSSALLPRPELQVRIDDARAAAAGVQPQAVADALRVATDGDDDSRLPRIELDGRSVPVRLRLGTAARDDARLLARLPVPAAGGRSVPLEEVASLHWGAGSARIDRIDRQRAVELDLVPAAGQPPGALARAAMAVAETQAAADRAAGITVQPAGDHEAMVELFRSFALAMATGVACICIVLVLLFDDLFQPLTVLGALGVALPGAVATLALTGQPLAMPTLIGLILLMGISAKNAILLVDYIILARRAGLPRDEAVLDGVRKRAQPVVMTSVAMAAGMLPTALGWGVDPSFRGPMAAVAIGGLFSSTLLSLVLIPLLYTLIDDARTGLLRRLGRRRPAEAPDTQTP